MVVHREKGTRLLPGMSFEILWRACKASEAIMNCLWRPCCRMRNNNRHQVMVHSQRAGGIGVAVVSQNQQGASIKGLVTLEHRVT